MAGEQGAFDQLHRGKCQLWDQVQRAITAI